MYAIRSNVLAHAGIDVVYDPRGEYTSLEDAEDVVLEAAKERRCRCGIGCYETACTRCGTIAYMCRIDEHRCTR